jgi:hypothetical protein
MRLTPVIFIAVALSPGCRKSKDVASDRCDNNRQTIRVITDRPAKVVVGATIYGAYYIEEGTIDTRLIPCEVPMEFMQHGLKVVISGEIKQRKARSGEPCCAEDIVITNIRKQ